MFTKFKEIPNEIIYTDRQRLKNGQTAWIFFQKEDYHITEYWVAFAVSDKRKYIKNWLLGNRNPIDNEITGKCGIEGLIWAKNKLLEFEQEINVKPFKIMVRGADSRRTQFYKKALLKFGYKWDYNLKCMYKTIT